MPKIFFFIASLVVVLRAQGKQSLPQDSIPHKQPLAATSTLLTTQLIPWSWNYYARKAAFAHISLESAASNLQLKSWEWDDNNFKTNQFAHPYHGSLYFNSFRSNGYSFWQSVPAAFAGSFIWETFGETHHPAINDFINTSFGGISIGEISHRLSDQLIDNSQWGLKRQLMEVSALLVNPINGFRRIVTKKWGRYGNNPVDYVPGLLSVQLQLGSRRYSEVTGELFYKGKNETFGGMRLQYGDPLKACRKPFGNFSASIELGRSDTALLNLVKIEATLFSRKVSGQDTGTRHIAALTMGYDYYHNTAFLYGAQSVGFKWLSNWVTGKKSTVVTQAGAGVIVLAAVPDKYLYYGEGRNYDYGPGVSLLFEANYIRKRFSYGIQYKGSWFHTLNGSQSHYYLQTITQHLGFTIYKNLDFNLEWAAFALLGNYHDEHPEVKKVYPYLRASYCYRFSL